MAIEWTESHESETIETPTHVYYARIFKHADGLYSVYGVARDRVKNQQEGVRLTHEPRVTFNEAKSAAEAWLLNQQEGTT